MMLLTVDTARNFQKSMNTANNIDDDLMTVNNFFTHFIKGMDIRRYIRIHDVDTRILPTNNTVDIYRYSDAMLKHMPTDALKTYDKTLLYCQKAVKLANNVDTRPNNTDNSRTGDKLDDRIDKLHFFLGKKIYRIPLRFLIDLCLVSFLDTFFTLERVLKRLFESKKKSNQS